MKGHVIEDESSLQSQGVRHEAQVLALLLTEAETVTVMVCLVSSSTWRQSIEIIERRKMWLLFFFFKAQEEERRKEVDRIKKDAKHLSHKDAMEDDFYFQVITNHVGLCVKTMKNKKNIFGFW